METDKISQEEQVVQTPIEKKPFYKDFFNQKALAPLLIILLITVILASGGAFYFFLSKQSSNSYSADYTNPKITNTQPRIEDKPIVANAFILFERGGSIYEANQDASVPNKLISDESIVDVSEIGLWYISKDSKGKHFLRSIDKSREAEIDPNSILGVWSQNSQLVAVYVRKVESKKSEDTYEIWDLQAMKQIRTIKDADKLGTAIALLNNENMLVQKVRNDNDRSIGNVDVYEYDTKENKLLPISTFTFNSMPARISPDETKLAYAYGHNLRIYTFSTKQNEKKTNLPEEINQEQVWNVYWSSDSKKVAFSTFGNTLEGSRIGFVNLINNTVEYITENVLPNEIRNKGRISNFTPVGWDKTNDSLYIKSEGIIEKENFQTERDDHYLLYNTVTKNIRDLSPLSNLKYIYPVIR